MFDIDSSLGGCYFGGYCLIAGLYLLLMSGYLVWFCLWVFGLGGLGFLPALCLGVDFLVAHGDCGVVGIVFVCGLCWLGGFAVV